MAIEPTTEAVGAEVTIAGLALEIEVMVRITAVPGRRTAGQDLSIADQVVAGTIVVEAVGMIIESHRAVMSGRKTGRWIDERTGVKIVGPIAAGNYAASTVPITWPVIMVSRGVIMPEWFRWISPIDRSEVSSTRDRISWRGLNERDDRGGTELKSCTM